MAESTEVYFEENRESAELGRQALRGGAISVTMQYANAVLQVVAAVVLARLLAPEDFGLVAIVVVLTNFAPLLIDFGLGDAAVQRSKITHHQVSSLFWVSSGIGVSIAVVVAISGPLIAWIYREPRLAPIAMYSATTFIFTGLSNQHLALLRRRMRFAAINTIMILGTVTGFAAAVVMALGGYGYWALVIRPVVNALSIAAGAWYTCRWRPGFPVFDKEVASMIHFGLDVVGFLLMNFLTRSMDRIALGLFYRPEVVGYYHNAITLYDNYFAALNQLHSVASAALSKLQSNPATLRQKYEAALSTLTFFVMPAAAILSVTGEDVTVILLGEKWRAAGVLLGIIALRGISQAIEGSHGWLHVAIGRADRWRNWGVVTTAIQVVAILAGLPFGATGIAVALVVPNWLVALPAIMYAGRPIDIGAAFVMRAAGPQLVGAVVTAAAGWWLQTTVLADLSSLARVVVSAGFCISVDLLVVVGLFRHVQPIKVAAKLVYDQLRRNR
jgi:O-antigen/teichoic acid export membrane protein